MRVLIQDCDSLKFLAGATMWVESADAARNFRGSIDALEYIRRNRMKRMRIVLKFSNDAFDVVLPGQDCADSLLHSSRVPSGFSPIGLKSIFSGENR